MRRSRRPSPRDSADKVIELRGKLITPGLVDLHQHLDKSHTRRLVRNSQATLEGASAGYRALAATATREEIAARAERTLDICLAHGTIAIRSHTNIETQSGAARPGRHDRIARTLPRPMTLQVVAHLTGDAPRKLADCREMAGRRGRGRRGRHRRRAAICRRAAGLPRSSLRVRGTQRTSARHAHRRASRQPAKSCSMR